MGPRFDLLLLTVALLFSPALSDLVLSKVDRRVDLTSQIVRITSTLKVDNVGKDSVSDVLLVFPDRQAKNLASLSAVSNAGKGKSKVSSVSLPAKEVELKGMPPSLVAYSVSLPEPLAKGDSFTIDVLAVYTHSLKPFPEKITQADIQLLVFEDSAHYLSAYEVKAQSLTVKLPQARIESYTKLENTKIHGSDIKYGPYENLPPFSYSPIVVHFESNRPFAVARELVREIEISHWGNVQVTEHYNIVNEGSEIKGEFSRLDFQARPHVRGPTAFRNLVAKLPPRAHSVYYRDEIGNISTSHLWGDFKKVVLPEGSRDISVSAPFPVKESRETKFSHLDLVGRPVIVLEKDNAVPEHNQYFQVYYTFSSISMLTEPLMLISGFFFLFITCIIYTHADVSISKSSPAYLAKLQWEEVRAVIQQVEDIFVRCLAIHDKLEASLHDLSRSGDVQACKASRKSADAALKELSKELKPLLSFVQSSSQAGHILPKVEELVTKERELQEKVMVKISTAIDCYEKKLGGREIENRVNAQQQRITALRQEVEDLLDFIDEL